MFTVTMVIIIHDFSQGRRCPKNKSLVSAADEVVMIWLLIAGRGTYHHKTVDYKRDINVT